MTFIVLWSPDQVFCSMSLSLALCDVFLMITSETMGLWEEKPLKMPFSSHHIEGTCCPGDTTIGVDLDHQAEVVLIRFLYCRVAPPTSCPVLFGRKFLCTQLLWLPHLMSGESCSPSLRRQSLHQLCRILLYRRNVHASLFIHSFIHLYQYEFTDMCFILWIIIHDSNIYFAPPIVPALAIWSPFTWLLCPFDILPSVCVWEPPYFSGLQDVLGSSCIFSAQKKSFFREFSVPFTGEWH